MTDKQIIDGVDVSGCEFCDYKSSNIPQCRIRLASFEPICEGYKCDYKLCKRAEKKLEKIKEIVNTHKRDKCVCCSEYDNCLGYPYCDEVILQIIEE